MCGDRGVGDRGDGRAVDVDKLSAVHVDNSSAESDDKLRTADYGDRMSESGAIELR
jgi:hypothetical protein